MNLIYGYLVDFKCIFIAYNFGIKFDGCYQTAIRGSYNLFDSHMLALM